jgi:aminoglycoside phosphotransferase family enzyme/predicted kinase
VPGTIGPAAGVATRTIVDPVIDQPANAPVVARETHTGMVFLVGDRAYKLKKAVRTDFLDFSTPARRLAACEREIALNRRLAPDVYLGIRRLLPLDGTEGTDADAEPVVVMRRMPAARRLSTLVANGHDVTAALRAIAHTVAGFHARAARNPKVVADGGAAALRRRWLANIAELRHYAGAVVNPDLPGTIEQLVLDFLDGRTALLRERDDRIVDGHGDLLADDIYCLDDGPRLLDCLDFDDHLRHVDGLDDAAFLAMDLEHLGHPGLAEGFLDRYAAFAADPAPSGLRHHYVAYRAVVRAKVALLRHDQGEPRAAADARAHLALALRHLRDGAVRLALVGGLPGTGKTTLGGALADRFGAVLLSSDRLRKELAGIDPQTPAPAGFGEGIYDGPHTEATYAELLHRAEVLVGRGESVVLDASWSDARHRRAAEQLAARTRACLVQLACRAPTETTGRRLATRARTASDATASDATASVATALAQTADPWPEAVGVPTDRPPAASLDLAGSVWRDAFRALSPPETGREPLPSAPVCGRR